MQQNSDLFLWEMFRKGDRNAFQSIYKKHVHGLINYGIKLSGDALLVEDCLHDLFVELWNSRLRLSSTTSIKFYLFKALRYKLLRTLSANQKKERLPLDGFMAVMKTPSEEQHVIELEVSSFQERHLKDSISKLPERQREAINLRYYHNFSNEEIARIMGIQYNSVCKFLNAALKNLRDQLKVAVEVIVALLVLPGLI